TAATFCQPTGLAMDPAGANLYVSDQCGFAIRQIALPSLAVTTVAGNGSVGMADGPAASASFSGLSGLCVDPHAGANLVYIVDTDKIRALRLGANPTVFTVAGATDSGQADGNASQVRFFNPANLTAIGDAAGANSTSLFVADSDNGLLRRLDISYAVFCLKKKNNRLLERLYLLPNDQLIPDKTPPHLELVIHTHGSS